MAAPVQLQRQRESSEKRDFSKNGNIEHGGEQQTHQQRERRLQGQRRCSRDTGAAASGTTGATRAEKGSRDAGAVGSLPHCYSPYSAISTAFLFLLELAISLDVETFTLYYLHKRISLAYMYMFSVHVTHTWVQARPNNAFTFV